MLAAFLGGRGMGLVSDAFSAVSVAVSSQVSHGRAAEVTVDPSSQHGHQGDNSVFVLNRDGAKFELFRSSHNLTYIYGRGDFAGYYGGGEQTIYD
jgi:hypothetical protein